jgi:hypothetical protein
MAQRIRFTLVEDGQVVRPYDFNTKHVQIGADPRRGDNLLIELPPRLQHVRAKILVTDDYVELEVVTGPVWLQGSRLTDGDIAELNVGDLLVFGTKKPRGVRLRFGFAKEAEIASWTTSPTGRSRRRPSASAARQPTRTSRSRRRSTSTPASTPARRPSSSIGSSTPSSASGAPVRRRSSTGSRSSSCSGRGSGRSP